jgi:hypothetical protein
MKDLYSIYYLLMIQPKAPRANGVSDSDLKIIAMQEGEGASFSPSHLK